MINDVNLIGYIIGGLVLFFILVGFVADKTGLIKKTFGKDANNTKQKEEKAVAAVVPVIESALEPIEDNDIEQGLKQNAVIDFKSINVNSNALEPGNPSESLASLEIVDDVANESDEVSDITNMESSNDDIDEFMLNDSLDEKMLFDEVNNNANEFMLNDDEFVQSDLTEENDVLSEVQNEVIESNEYEETEETGEDNNNNDSIVIDSNLDEIVFPELEEIEDNEEDVWKF